MRPHFQLFLLALMLSNEGHSVTLNSNEARTVCVAKCLKTFKSQVTGRLARILADPRAINRECQEVSSNFPSGTDKTAVNHCQSCSFACNHYSTRPYSGHENCLSFCQEIRSKQGYDQTTCRISCVTLEKMLTSGLVSPEPGGITKTPEIPNAPRAKRPSGKVTSQAPADSFIELDWAGYNWTTPDPVVFLVQFRSWEQKQNQRSQVDDLDDEDTNEEDVGPASNDSSSHWSDLAITTNTKLLVDDIAPAIWYQFRVAAISPAGLRGYSMASEPLKHRAAAGRPPGPVRDLQEGISQIRDSRVDVQILWQAPEPQPGEVGVQSIQAYKIEWTEVQSASNRQSNSVKSHSLPGAQTEYLITNLKPATTYKVTVIAVIIHGSNQRYKSRPSIYVTTMQLPTLNSSSSSNPDKNRARNPQSNDSPVKSQFDKSNEPAHTAECSCQERPATLLVTKQPYYENGDLKLLLLWPRSTFETGPSAELVNTYTVSWSQRVCIESDFVGHNKRQTVVHNTLMLNITGLRFNCHYALQFNGLTRSGKVAFTWNTCFCTASCKETKIKGNKFPTCPKTEGNTTPQPPDRLRVTPLLRATSTQNRLASSADAASAAAIVAAQLFWAAPSYPPLRAILSFRVKWGPREPEEVPPDAYSTDGLSPRMNEGQAITSVVDMRERSQILHSLLPATVYIVSVQTLSFFGDSRPAVIHFTTPDLISSSSSTLDGEAQADQWEVQNYFIGPGADKNALVTATISARLVILATMTHWLWAC